MNGGDIDGFGLFVASPQSEHQPADQRGERHHQENDNSLHGVGEAEPVGGRQIGSAAEAADPVDEFLHGIAERTHPVLQLLEEGLEKTLILFIREI